MREQIVEILCPFYEDCPYRKESSCFTLGAEWCICQGAEKANHILTLISKEIEKVDNPYPCNEDWVISRSGFEDCRQKVLALLRSKE